MELAGLGFLDSPGSGSSRFLEPQALKASGPQRKPFTLNTNLKKNEHPEQKTCDNSGSPQQTDVAEKARKMAYEPA